MTTTFDAPPSVRHDRAIGPPAAPGSFSSYAMLSVVAAEREPATLDDVLGAASLQTRTDHKYLLTPEQFSCFAKRTEPRLRALEIDGERMFGYESVYFDTPDLALYRGHRQGRRRRFKVRTRTYVDSGECMVEVKVKGKRGQTVKARMPYDAAHRQRLDAAARAFVADVLQEAYGVTVPRLEPSVTTRYSRSTFVDLADATRLTCDVDLACSNAGGQRYGPDRILVESKSAGSAAADRELAALGIRPISMSKYCIGVALLHPHESANRWNRILRGEFGWQPARAA